MDPADRAARLAADAPLRLRADPEFAWQILTTRPTRTFVDATAGSFGVRLIPAASVGRWPPAPGVSGAPGRSGAFVLGAS